MWSLTPKQKRQWNSIRDAAVTREERRELRDIYVRMMRLRPRRQAIDDLFKHLSRRFGVVPCTPRPVRRIVLL